MPREYYSRPINIGDIFEDREIIGIKPNKAHKNTIYVYRCECGFVGEIKRDPFLKRIKDRLMGCEKCRKPSRVTLEFGYEQAGIDLAFVNRHWKCSSITR